MSCPEFKNSLCVHPSGDGLYYADFTDDDRLYSDTIASVTSVTCDDADVTISNQAVVTGATVVPYQGGTRTIAANKGIRFRLAGGTAQADSDDPAKITILCLTTAGYTLAAVGLLVVDD